ncbi:hypothetical protein ACHAXA_006053 [Cyclostephanos tholiformis]|uniref:Transmembrane protein n=1 Tax=Cyclostephanos tholiformis TaxID=382380 RepID=A0ABD3SAT7_9STRA
MSRRGLRNAPTTIRSRSHYTALLPHHASILSRRTPRTSRGSVVVPPSNTKRMITSPPSPSRRHPWIGHYFGRYGGHSDHSARQRATTTRSYGGNENKAAPPGRESPSSDDGGGGPASSPSSSSVVVVYEGPFASLTLKLKRISLTSAVIGVVGLPALSLFGGSSASSVPASGQLAVIVTAGIAAVGSTALLGYCFSPYVHTMERILPTSHAPTAVVEDGTARDDAGGEADVDGSGGDHRGTTGLVRIVTRDILARRVETVFDPATDVSPPPNVSSRPFCNFIVKGMPMYVHPELVHDEELRFRLLGEDMQQQAKNVEARNKAKSDDDEFL